jgi:hypothetical protein
MGGGGGHYMCKNWGGSWAWAYLHRRIHMGMGAYGCMGLGVGVACAIGSCARVQLPGTTHVQASLYCVW